MLNRALLVKITTSLGQLFKLFWPSAIEVDLMLDRSNSRPCVLEEQQCKTKLRAISAPTIYEKLIKMDLSSASRWTLQWWRARIFNSQKTMICWATIQLIIKNLSNSITVETKTKWLKVPQVWQDLRRVQCFHLGLMVSAQKMRNFQNQLHMPLK